MGEFVDMVKGVTNEAVGNAKVAVGKSTDHPGLIVKGKAQEAKGKAQRTMGKIKGKFGDRI